MTEFVPACHECNMIAYDRLFFCKYEKRRFIYYRLVDRYTPLLKRKLELPDKKRHGKQLYEIWRLLHEQKRLALERIRFMEEQLELDPLTYEERQRELSSSDCIAIAKRDEFEVDWDEAIALYSKWKVSRYGPINTEKRIQRFKALVTFIRKVKQRLKDIEVIVPELENDL